MNWCTKYLLAVFAVLLIDNAVGHLQCLNGLPPFKNIKPRHCSQYNPHTCCTNADSRQVKQRVNRVLRQSLPDDRTARDQCKSYLRNVACTVCSPYAAHMYEAETADSQRSLPSLCDGYCQLFYDACYPVLFDYYQLNSTGYDESSAERFCKDHMANSQKYCYPTVKSVPHFKNDTKGVKYGDKLQICALPIASGLRNPTALVHSNDKTGRLFVAEQIGVIHVITKDRVRLPTPFLDISDRVLTSSAVADRRGLLGIAFHPDFKVNGKFYVYYSANSSSNDSTVNHESRVSQFIALNGNNVADISSEEIVMTIPQPHDHQNGGQLLFGYANGLLYIFLGDGGGGGNMTGRIGNALDRSTLLGSVLRINVDSLPYTIPQDNPFVNNIQWRPEIYAYGLRSPWRCSFDKGDPKRKGKGRLFCGDVGEDTFEEINLIVKGGNYGWRAFEGNECFDPAICNEYNDTVFPIHTYPHSVGRSVIGGHVYRGCSYLKLQGLYFFADYEMGTIWAMRKMKDTWTVKPVHMGGDDVCHGGVVGEKGRARHIISFGEDESGELYILATDMPSPASPQGVVYQIIEPYKRAYPSKCRRRN